MEKNCFVKVLRANIDNDELPILGENKLFSLLDTLNPSFVSNSNGLTFYADKAVKLIIKENGNFCDSEGVSIGKVFNYDTPNTKVSIYMSSRENSEDYDVYVSDNTARIVFYSVASPSKKDVFLMNINNINDINIGFDTDPYNKFRVLNMRVTGNLTDFLKSQYINNSKSITEFRCTTSNLLIDSFDGTRTISNTGSNNIFYITWNTDGFSLTHKFGSSGATVYDGKFTYSGGEWNVTDNTPT